MQFYRRNLPHMQRDYTPHFITFCTKFRRILPDWARDIVLGCCVHDDGRRYLLKVAVVMPDHVHLILTPSTDQTRQTIVSLVEIMKAIKGTSSARDQSSCGGIWRNLAGRVIRQDRSLCRESGCKDRLHFAESGAEGISPALARLQMDLAGAESKPLFSTRNTFAITLRGTPGALVRGSSATMYP
jgi:REP element-mobilizing transposase RayT